MSTIFIATKPIQIVSCYQIADQYGIEDARLYVCRHFPCDSGLSSRLQSRLDIFSDVQLFERDNDAIHKAASERPSDLYLDSDTSYWISKYLKLIKQKYNTKIYIYEEGLHTYDPNPYKAGLLRKILFRFLGYSIQMGESQMIDGIYVTQPALYSKLYPEKPTYFFRLPFFPGEDCRVDWLSLFGGLGLASGCINPASSTASLILSSHRMESIHAGLKYARGDLFIKVHPHIYGNFTQEIDQQDAQFFESIVPVEFCIFELLRRYEHLQVIHDKTTVQFHLGFLPSIEWVDVSNEI